MAEHLKAGAKNPETEADYSESEAENLKAGTKIPDPEADYSESEAEIYRPGIKIRIQRPTFQSLRPISKGRD